MNFNEITSFLWGTADLLRNTYKQHEYGGIILPFTVMRRVDIALMSTKEKVLEVDSNTPKDSKFRESKLMKAAATSVSTTHQSSPWSPSAMSPTTFRVIS